MADRLIPPINIFSGSGVGGIFFNEGFFPSNENGKSMMSENFVCYEKFNDLTTGFTNLAYPKAVAYLNTLNLTKKYRFIVDSSSLFYTYFENGATEGFSGRVGGTGSSGDYYWVFYPDILELPSGNLIYTSSKHLGLIIRGKCKTGSNTVKIIDTDGRNFATLGLTSAGNVLSNKVYNLKTGAEYTITSISTTTSTNDTLNFSAVGANTNTADDEFVAYVMDKWDLKSGLTIPTFKGQPAEIYWHRQIKDYYGVYYILNGNYIAKLSNDETTFANNTKQLPYGHQALCFGINSNNILIASVKKDGSYLLLWDGANTNWNNILKIDNPIYALKAYKDGWIFVSDGIIYFTNGWQIQKYGTEYCDDEIVSSYHLRPSNFNELEILNDTIFFSFNQNNYNRKMPGVYVYNQSKGWSYIPVKYNNRNYNTPSGIFINTNYDWTFGTFGNQIEVGGSQSLNILSTDTSSSDWKTTQSKSFIYFVDLKSQIQPQRIELNVSVSLRKWLDTANPQTAKITVSIGNGDFGIFQTTQSSEVSATDKVKVYGSDRSGEVGDEVLFMDGDLAGERTFITAIENTETDNELWTVSPVLSDTTANVSNLKLIKVKKCETKTINYNDLKKPIVFKCDGSLIYTKMFIEVVVHGLAQPFNVSILGINIY